MCRHLAPNQCIKSLWWVYLRNKAAVCDEQSVSESWSPEAIRHGWERDEQSCPSCFCAAIRLSVFAQILFPIQWMQPLWQRKEAWQVEHSLEQKERKRKTRSRALARPSTEPPHHVVQAFASSLCFFFWQKIGKAASAPLASPAVLDISSTVVNPAVKVYICWWRNGCTTR